jgi:hypothetical protein
MSKELEQLAAQAADAVLGLIAETEHGFILLVFENPNRPGGAMFSATNAEPLTEALALLNHIEALRQLDTPPPPKVSGRVHFPFGIVRPTDLLQ